MMKSYFKNTTADSFNGILLSLEGIKGSLVILNGPSGCKFYHSSTSFGQMIRTFDFDPLNYPEKWYFGQPQIPCTSIDNGDYVYGSADKLVELLEFVRDGVEFDALFIVNSPGAALIGDDLRGLAEKVIDKEPVIILESPGFSETLSAGYKKAFLSMLPFIKKDGTECKNPRKLVNIIGLGIWGRNSLGDREELQRLCDMMNIDVNCVLMSGSTFADIEKMAEADLNVVVAPEFGLEIGEILKEKFGIPYMVTPPPIGFSVTEKWAMELCATLEKTSRPCAETPVADLVIEESQKRRAECFHHISRINSLIGIPTGRPFAVEGRYSEVLAYGNFLLEYLGMTPDSLSIIDEKEDAYKEDLVEFLKKYGVAYALDVPILETDAELVLAGGNTIGALKLQGKCFAGIDISLPTLGYIDVIPKTHLGLKGGSLLVELVLNGLV